MAILLAERSFNGRHVQIQPLHSEIVRNFYRKLLKGSRNLQNWPRMTTKFSYNFYCTAMTSTSIGTFYTPARTKSPKIMLLCPHRDRNDAFILPKGIHVLNYAKAIAGR